MHEHSRMNRRVILGAMTGLAAPVGPAAASDGVQSAADNLSATLRRAYGGQWSAHVDRVNGFVLVTSRTDPARPVE